MYSDCLLSNTQSFNTSQQPLSLFVCCRCSTPSSLPSSVKLGGDLSDRSRNFHAGTLDLSAQLG